MKSRLSQCRQYLEEVEAKILELQKQPSPDLTGHELVSMSEALIFLQHAIAAVSRTEKELQSIRDQAVRIDDSPPDAGDGRHKAD